MLQGNTGSGSLLKAAISVRVGSPTRYTRTTTQAMKGMRASSKGVLLDQLVSLPSSRPPARQKYDWKSPNATFALHRLDGGIANPPEVYLSSE